MTHHKKVFPIFVRHFFRYFWMVREVLLALVVLVILGAIVISYVEDLNLKNSIYLSFITAFTIGYGDITPVTTIGRILSVIIGLIGIIFTGLVVAVSTRALVDTARDKQKNNS